MSALSTEKPTQSVEQAVQSLTHMSELRSTFLQLYLAQEVKFKGVLEDLKKNNTELHNQYQAMENQLTDSKTRETQP